jgi:hypothetical protein
MVSSTAREGRQLELPLKGKAKDWNQVIQDDLAKGLKLAPKHDHSTFATSDGQFNISQSKVKTYTQCRRMFHYKFVMMLQPKKKARPLVFGDLAHRCIEAWAEGKKWRKVLRKEKIDNGKMFRRELEHYGDILKDIEYIMADYFEHWEETGDLRLITHDGRRSEHEFRIQLADGIWFTGKIDMMARSKRMNWLVEHKSFARLPSEDDRWRSVQAAVYFNALEMMGFKRVDGVLWDYIGSKACDVPGKLTKTGKVSQAKMDTLPTRVRAWIEENGFKERDYAKLLQDSLYNRSSRFIRLYSPIKRSVVGNIWSEFVDTAREMVDCYGKKKNQNIGRHCNWCQYRALCKAEATGSDVDWIISREFEKEGTDHKNRSEDD